MPYYVQDFKFQTSTTTQYGEQTAHNHDRSIQFTKDALDWLVNTFHWPRAAIELGKFKSGQNKPAVGREFKWNEPAKKWVKV
jgi:hypothetical protein